MNPLTCVLAMLTGTVTAGAFLVVAFALGLYGWPSVLVAFALAAFGVVALARRIEQEIKRQDPAWDEMRDRPRPLAVARPRIDVPGGRFGPRRRWRR